MDGMKIESKFMTSVVSKLLSTVIRRKVGYNVGIKLNNVNVVITDGTAQVHLDADAELSKEELLKLLKGIGLE